MTMERLVTGGYVAKAFGYDSMAEWFASLSASTPGLFDSPFTGKTSGEPVVARVDAGRWIADCPCGGAAYVDRDEPIFYCLGCGNRSNDGDARPVVFPDSAEAIEEELLKRPVDDARGRNEVERALNAIPLIPGLQRSWCPGETVNSLKEIRQYMEVQV